jgi:hypothetical protein
VAPAPQPGFLFVRHVHVLILAPSAWRSQVSGEKRGRWCATLAGIDTDCFREKVRGNQRDGDGEIAFAFGPE